MTVDPEAVAARLERDREIDQRAAAAHAAHQKELDIHGEKNCLNTKTCSAAIPKDAKVCPECGKQQGQSGSGHLSGANRRSRRSSREIVFTFGGQQ